MGTQSNWYEDAEQLLGAVKQSRAPAPRQPSIPGYDELREIRRGGQGVVFSATQRSTKRRVAIKVLLDGAWASDSRRRRFEREIDLIATLHHPNIVRLYDSGVTDAGYPYYVMEFIEGVGLDELIGDAALADDWSKTHRGEPLDVRVPMPRSEASPLFSVRATFQLFAKVCDAVNYAHQRGVIHRDLKPSNIRIDPAGEPFVLDFGLAKAATDSHANVGESPMSLTGEFMGSPPWASPEQADGSPHATDVRSDVYALGVILFQLLTRRFPYPVVGGLREVLHNIQSIEPLRPSSLRRELDDEVDTLVLKCLAKEPDRRYQSAGDLARDIRHYLANEPIEAKRDSALYTLRKAMRRYKYVARITSVFLLITLGAAVLLSVLWLRATEAEQLADQRLDAAEKARAAEVVARTESQRKSAQTHAINLFLVNMLTMPLDLGREARVADVLDKASRELAESTDLDAPTAAALHEAIGNAYSSLGLFAESEPQLQAAYDLWRGAAGAEHPDTLSSLAAIAWLKRQQGKLDEAVTLLRQVLDARRRVLGDDHIDTTRTMNDLAYVLEMLGQLDEAEALHRAALANSRRLLGEDALDTLTSMGNLASVLCTQGKLEEAGSLMRQRLETARRVLGPQHRDTLRAMSSYSRLLGITGPRGEALALLRAVLENERRILGADHPETIVAIANLGLELSHQGQFGEAEPLLREAVERAQRVLGPEHTDTLGAMGALAGMLNVQGRYAEAEPLLRAALETSRRTNGDEHLDTLYAMNSLAQCLQLQERPTDAEPIYRAALEGCLRALGESSPYTSTAMVNLGTALTDLQRFDEAEPLIRRALEQRRQAFGAEALETLHARVQLGTLLYERGDFQAAADEFGALLEKVRQVMPPEHWYPAVVEGWYGRALAGLQRFAEAEAHMLAAYERLSATVGAAHPRARRLRQRIVELYDAWDRPADAARFRATPESQPTSDAVRG